VLMKKPGALRNGAPFKDWIAARLTQVRIKLKQHATGIDSSSRCWAQCSIMAGAARPPVRKFWRPVSPVAM